jgi:CTP-dependent riboflavin kinase
MKIKKNIKRESSLRLTKIKKKIWYITPRHLKLLYKNATGIAFKNSFSGRAFNCYSAYVISGRSKAKNKVIKWNEAFNRKINKTFFPGTLNLILDKPIMLEHGKAYKFANRYLLWEGMLNNEAVYFMRWNTCPLHVIEVLSSHNLRNTLNLKDGDEINLRIKCDYISSLTMQNKIAWWVLWKKREPLYYSSDPYCNVLRKYGFLRYLRGLASQLF